MLRRRPSQLNKQEDRVMKRRVGVWEYGSMGVWKSSELRMSDCRLRILYRLSAIRYRPSSPFASPPTPPHIHTSILPYLFIVLLFGLAGTAGAQDAVRAENELGVYEAIGLARMHGPALNQLREQVQAKGGERLTSFGIYAPEIIYTREGISGGGFAEQRWGISQTIDFPLQSYYRLRRVDTERQALDFDVEAALNGLTVAVKKAYTHLLYAQEMIHLREEEVRLAAALQEAASVRVEVGEASELEQMKADIGLAEAQSNLEDARQAFENARYALFHVVGLDPDQQHYEIAFPDTLVYIDVDVDQERVLQRIAVQPELQSAVLSQEAARLGVQQTRSALLPALKVDVFPQDFGTGYDFIRLQFALHGKEDVPLFRGEVDGGGGHHAGRLVDARARLEVPPANVADAQGKETLRRHEEGTRLHPRGV